MKVVDLKCQTFGSWIVEKRVSNDANGKAMWQCYCSNCKRNKIIRSAQLRSNWFPRCICRNVIVPNCPPKCRLIPLTQGKFAIVDKEDFDRVNQFVWYFDNGYATRYAIGNKHIKMHRFITKAHDGIEVDHKDGNKLNNQKFNLRLATRSNNNWNRGVQCNNTSTFKGVGFDISSGKWRARIGRFGKQITLGRFNTPEKAAKVYAKAAKKLHGEFMRLKWNH